MNAWSHLPNAAHIDAILTGVRARPKIWAAAFATVPVAARMAAHAAALDAAWIAKLDTAVAVVRNVLQGAAWSDTWGAGWSGIRALVTWPESAAMLDLTPDALRTIISTCDGDVKHQAVLLLPAVIARSTV